MSDLIWIQTVYKSYQQTTLGDKELSGQHLVGLEVEIDLNLFFHPYFAIYTTSTSILRAGLKLGLEDK